MGEDALNKAGKAIKHVADDAKDSLHETGHRTVAEGEKARRELLGDEMTTREKVGSAVNEAKNRTQAEIDAAKRKVRDHTS
jgi:ElaB/YqjD/DUF883 family membrane-anchored ribosome-binding protein